MTAAYAPDHMCTRSTWNVYTSICMHTAHSVWCMTTIHIYVANLMLCAHQHKEATLCLMLMANDLCIVDFSLLYFCITFCFPASPHAHRHCIHTDNTRNILLSCPSETIATGDASVLRAQCVCLSYLIFEQCLTLIL